MTEYTTLPPGWVLRLTDDGSVVLSGPKRGQYSCVGGDEPNAAGQALYDLGRALAASAGDAGADATGRTPKDYAIEHAEYLAQAGESLLEAMNDVFEAEQAIEDFEGDEDENAVAAAATKLEHALERQGDAMSRVGDRVYEFRKRRDRSAALSAPTAGETAAPQVGAAPSIKPNGFNPAHGSPETAAQMAAVMLLHGTKDQQQQAAAHVAAAPEVAAPQPRPMDTAPKDGTLLRLLVKPDAVSFTAFDDSREPSWTAGFNNLEDTGEDRWQFAGWSWNHDCIIEGFGEPLGWLPMLDDRAAQAACTGGAA